MAKKRWWISPNLIRYLREKAGSVKDLANLIGISERQLYRIQRGQEVTEDIMQGFKHYRDLYRYCDIYKGPGIL